MRKNSVLEERVDWAELNLTINEIEAFFGPPPRQASYKDDKFVNGVLLYLYTARPKVKETKISEASGRPLMYVDEVMASIKIKFDKHMKIQKAIEAYFCKKDITFNKDFQSYEVTMTPPSL